MNKLHSKKYIPIILKELSERPDLENKICHVKDEFVRYAALERVNFEPDLDDEVKCFFLRKRLSDTNPKEWERLRKIIFERDRYTCQYCGQKGGLLEVDHIIPLCRGGGNDLDNLITACRKCNRQKHDKTKEEYLKWLKRKT